MEKPHKLEFFYCTHNKEFDTIMQVREYMTERARSEKNRCYIELTSYGEHMWTKLDHVDVHVVPMEIGLTVEESVEKALKNKHKGL